jgi:glycosyltransferase involved in cell wall biosynthesis
MFLKYYTPRYLKAASRIVTVSEFSRNDIMKQYGISRDRISVIPNGAREIFSPLNVEEKEAVRQQYSEGKQYFIYSGSIHPRKNLISLLKAFSRFKKRQKSNWKLVLAGRLAWKNEPFLASLKTYKYREDVVMTGYVDEQELARLTGAAYAMVYPSLWEGFGMPVIDAMRSGVPVITTSGSAMEEVGGSAAMYAHTADPQDLGEKMMTLYKDEQLRARLVEAGLRRAMEYDWNKSAERMWDEIRKLLPVDQLTS